MRIKGNRADERGMKFIYFVFFFFEKANLSFALDYSCYFALIPDEKTKKKK